MRFRIQKRRLVGIFIVILLLITGFLIKTKLPTEKQTAPTNTPTTTSNDPRTAVLTFPKPNATEKEQNDYAAIVAKYAKKTNTVTITNCKPDPVAAEVVYKSTITLKNEDSSSHTISTDQDHFVAIPANSTATMSADFGQPTGIFAYGCDNSPSGVGVFAIR